MSTAASALSTPPALRDLMWIRGVLQTAIALEHSTMPIYSAAMFSLEVQNYPTYNAIRSVLMEEMAHMAAAANMLAALGGTPRIVDLEPRYPCYGLPGGVAKDLHSVVAQLSERQLRNFLRIESPAWLLDEQSRRQAYATVGELYEALRAAIIDHRHDVRRALLTGGTAHQVGGNIGFKTIDRGYVGDPIEQFLEAIDVITSQGEGESDQTIGAGKAFENEGSHYARFAELVYGRRYQQPDPPPELSASTETLFFQGEEIGWPVVINTLAVPSDGYAAVLAHDPDAAAVRTELLAFDGAYTAMMRSMDDMWNGPLEQSWPSFGRAVEQMNELRVISCFNVMRLPVPAPIVRRLDALYPEEYELLAQYTDLDRPVFYGPRFFNLAARGLA
ncbi:MAG: ferritin-like family protein [Frankiales bacterium]|nr:ferritin-like family protein [Frankiales bacterium]